VIQVLEDLEAMVDSEDGINEKITHNSDDVVLSILCPCAGKK